MAENNTLTSMNTQFKIIQDNAASLLPENAVMMKLTGELREAQKIGQKFLVPVQLSHENGVTYSDGDVNALVEASAAVYTQIEVNSGPQVLQTRISYDVADRIANTKQTFITEMTLRSRVMYQSAVQRLEISMLYGRSGLGSTTGSGTVVDGTHHAITLTAASWSPGIWASSIGAVLNIYDVSNVIVGTGADQLFTVQKVDVLLRKVTLTATSGGVTALITALGGGACTPYFLGSYTNDMIGLDKQITGGTTIFGIDPTIYPLWQGQSYSSSSAQLTMAKVLQGSAIAVGAGGLISEAVLMTSAKTYASLNSDLAALRDYDKSYDPKEGENGFDGITYRGPVKIRVMINNICKEGEAFLFPKEHLYRVGVTDLTFRRGGLAKEDFFEPIPGYTGYSLQCRSNFAVLMDRPAQCVKFTAIVNAA